jgi:CBS-domain-containing membrane protein
MDVWSIGVLSQTDILIHDRVDNTLVRDLMTPAVFAVGPKSPASKVVEEMCELNVHRLFVVDGNGVLVGVISALDVLRHLNARED